MKNPGIAIITGASSGIGLSTAQLFLNQGWYVINVSRRPSPLEAVHHICADLSEADFLANASGPLQQVLQDLRTSYPGPLTLVHNAAYFNSDSALGLDPKELTRALQVNVVAPAALNGVITPLMQPGDSIIYIGSTLAEKGIAQCASYVTSKHAVVGLMRATCQDMLGRQLHTVCICPGFVDTPMLRRGRDDAAMAPYAQTTTYERILRSEEIADLVWTSVHTPCLHGSVMHANYGQIER